MANQSPRQAARGPRRARQPSKGNARDRLRDAWDHFFPWPLASVRTAHAAMIPSLPFRFLAPILPLLLLIGLASHPRAQADEEDARKRILFFGDSLTAGYGIGRSQAYPALIARRIEKAGLPYEVVPAGLSGETSAGGLRRIDWMLRRRIDVLVLALGANDGLRGIDPAETEANLQGIIDKAQAKNPGLEVVLAGMRAPPNMGEAYASKFRDIFPRLAERNDAALAPFLLEGVGGERRLNLPDGIHPNPEGHRIVAENVWEALEPLLAKDADQP